MVEFDEQNIIDYLTSLTDKPYNVVVKEYYSMQEIKYPCMTVCMVEKSDRIVLQNKNKLVNIGFAFEIYAKSIKDKTATYVLRQLENWLDAELKSKYGFQRNIGSPIMPVNKENSILREVITYSGIISEYGYIYKR